MKSCAELSKNAELIFAIMGDVVTSISEIVEKEMDALNEHLKDCSHQHEVTKADQALLMERVSLCGDLSHAANMLLVLQDDVLALSDELQNAGTDPDAPARSADPEEPEAPADPEETTAGQDPREARELLAAFLLR